MDKIAKATASDETCAGDGSMLCESSSPKCVISFVRPLCDCCCVRLPFLRCDAIQGDVLLHAAAQAAQRPEHHKRSPSSDFEMLAYGNLNRTLQAWRDFAAFGSSHCYALAVLYRRTSSVSVPWSSSLELGNDDCILQAYRALSTARLVSILSFVEQRCFIGTTVQWVFSFSGARVAKTWSSIRTRSILSSPDDA